MASTEKDVRRLVDSTVETLVGSIRARSEVKRDSGVRVDLLGTACICSSQKFRMKLADDNLVLEASCKSLLEDSFQVNFASVGADSCDLERISGLAENIFRYFLASDCESVYEKLFYKLQILVFDYDKPFERFKQNFQERRNVNA